MRMRPGHHPHMSRFCAWFGGVTKPISATSRRTTGPARASLPSARPRLRRLSLDFGGCDL